MERKTTVDTIGALCNVKNHIQSEGIHKITSVTEKCLYSYKYYYNIAQNLKIPEISCLKKERLAELIKLYEDYPPPKISDTSNYIREEQLGVSGKEGTTFKVTLNDKVYAMKTFKKTKSGNTLIKEAYLQHEASLENITPHIYAIDVDNKCIVMDCLDKTLINVLQEQKGRMTEIQQLQLLRLYYKMDQIGLVHNDANPLNIMTKGDKLHLIDFGFTKRSEHTKFKSYDNPNWDIMPLGLLLWVKDKCPTKNWKFMRGSVPRQLYNKLKISTWK
jgi:serine/threonine protein kinase